MKAKYMGSLVVLLGIVGISFGFQNCGKPLPDSTSAGTAASEADSERGNGGEIGLGSVELTFTDLSSNETVEFLFIEDSLRLIINHDELDSEITYKWYRDGEVLGTSVTQFFDYGPVSKSDDQVSFGVEVFLDDKLQADQTKKLVVKGPGRVSFMLNFNANVWSTNSMPFSKLRPLIDMTGDNYWGPMLAGGVDGRQVAYKTGLGDVRWFNRDEWVFLNPAPFRIQGITGAIPDGPVVFNGHQVAIMTNYQLGVWEELGRAPYALGGMSGNNTSGVVYFGSGDQSKEVGHISYFKLNNWTSAPQAPFSVEAIAGDVRYGPIILGTDSNKVKKLALIKNHPDYPWYQLHSWRVAPALPAEDLIMVDGDNRRGVIVSNGSDVWYSRNPVDASSWVKMSRPPDPPKFLSGELLHGAMTFGY